MQNPRGTRLQPFVLNGAIQGNHFGLFQACSNTLDTRFVNCKTSKSGTEREISEIMGLDIHRKAFIRTLDGWGKICLPYGL